jgi:hypothetical protein
MLTTSQPSIVACLELFESTLNKLQLMALINYVFFILNNNAFYLYILSVIVELMVTTVFLYIKLNLSISRVAVFNNEVSVLTFATFPSTEL